MINTKITLERITGNVQVDRKDCKEVEIENKPSILIYDGDVFRKVNDKYYIAFEKRTMDALIDYKRKKDYS